MSCLGIKRRSPIPELSIRLFREILNIIISGSTMTNDRLVAAGLSDTDQCTCCGAQHTMLHLDWHCKFFADIRKPYLDDLETIAKQAFRRGGQYSADYVQEIISYGPMQLCGICPEDVTAIGRIHASDDTSDPGLTRAVDHLDLVDPLDPHLVYDDFEGTNYIVAFPDGSTFCPKSFWLAHSGWGVFYGPGCQYNISSKTSWQLPRHLSQRTPCYFGNSSESHRSYLDSI